MAILKEEFSFMNQSSRISKLFHTNYLSTAYTDCCLTLKMVEKNYLYRRTTVTKYNIKSFVEALNEILLAWKDSSSNMHWNHLNVKETLPSTEILSLRYAGQCFLVIGSQYYNKKCFVKDCIILAVCYFSVKFLTLAFFFYLWKGWPNNNLVREIFSEGCHLVGKQPKGHNIDYQEKGFLWRYSFSAAEKRLFLQGEQGEANSCRKKVLRIVKALQGELNLKPLKSYHLKTLLFYECESHPDASEWRDTLDVRFLDLLESLEKCLHKKCCAHYFIKDLNLFESFSPQECEELANRVKKIRSQPQQVLNKLL